MVQMMMSMVQMMMSMVEMMMSMVRMLMWPQDCVVEPWLCALVWLDDKLQDHSDGFFLQPVSEPIY